jgi:Toprim domain/CHC2 zinc finger
MFTEDELDQARAVPVAEWSGVKLKKEGHTLVGPCPICGKGDDRFIVWPKSNRWHCRWCQESGDIIKLVMRLRGRPFPDAVEELIGKAPSGTLREPTPEDIAKWKAREEQQRQEEAAERGRQQFIEATAARIIAGIVPIWSNSLAKHYLSDRRRIEVEKIRDVLERIDAIGFHPAVYLKEPGHPLHGQFLPAIIAIQTDPVTAAPNGAIARTYLDKDGRKLIGLDGKSLRAKSLGTPGIVRLSRDEDVLSGLHIAEGLENALTAMAKGFAPCWSMGSTTQMIDFPVLGGIESLTIFADNDEKGGGLKAAITTGQRWRAAGRELHILEPPSLGDINDVLRGMAR